MTVEAWKCVRVFVEPFPRAPFSGDEEEVENEPFIKIGEAACGEPGCGPDWWTWEVSLGMSHGVMEFGFFDDEETGDKAPTPDEAAGHVARLLAELGYEAADIYGRTEWSVMRK